MYNRIADYGLRTGFKGELKSGNHIFLVLLSFLFSASLKCIKSSFGSCFCFFIFKKQKKCKQCKHKILLYLSETGGFLIHAEESPEV